MGVVVTDQERARALAEALLGPVGLTGAVLAALEQSFAAVRRNEQRALFRYFRTRLADEDLVDAWQTLDDAMARVERGEVVP